MFRKLSKGLSFLALVILSLGAVFFMPSFFKQTKANESENNLEMSTVDFSAADVETSIEFHHGIECMVIDSAEDLARVSFGVLQGDPIYVDGNFYLNADINLQTGLWVPIGTSTNPFNGNFFGNGHTISNITIAQATQIPGSDIGLFGNVTGSISDLTVNGVFALSQLVDTTSVNLGVITGSLGVDGEIINCFDNSIKMSNLEDTKSIGNADSSATIVLTASKTGVSGDVLYSSKEEMAQAVSYNGTPTIAYTTYFNTNAQLGETDEEEGIGVGFYSNGKYIASAMNGDSEVVNQQESQQVRVAFSTIGDDGSYSNIVDIKNPMYFENIPVLRENATEGQVYALKAGQKATIGQPVLSQAGIVDLSWQSASVNVTYNYGYGDPSTRTYSFATGYDTPWKNVIENKPIVRIGYNGTSSLFTDESKENALNQTDKTQFLTYYPSTNSTVYMTWDSPKTLSAKLYFGVDQNEGGAFMNRDASKAYSNLEMTGADFEGNDISNYVVGNSLTIKFTLNAGYTFQAAGVGTNLVTEYEWAQSENVTTLSKGLYTYYPYATGEGDSYTAGAHGYYDSYLPVKSVVAVDENSYTITIENIFTEGGAIVLLFGREEKQIPITGNNINEISNATLNGNSNQTVLDWEGKTLTTKMGETFNFVVSIGTSDFYILGHNVKGFSAVVNDENATLVGGSSFYKQKTFVVSAFEPELNATEFSIELNIDRLLTYITVQIGENGTFYEDNNVTETKRSNAVISATGQSNQSTTGKLTLQVPMSVNTTITFDANGYFSLAGAEINEEIAAVENNAIVRTFAEYSNNPESPAYVITLFPTKNSYSVTIKYTIDGEEVEEEIASKYVSFSGTTSNLDFDKADPYVYTISLTDNAKVWLNYDFNVVGSDLGTNNTGYQASEIVDAVNGKLDLSFDELTGSTQFNYKAGTFNSTITVNLTSKNITVNFENAKLNGAYDIVETKLYNTLSLKYAVNGDGVLSITDGGFSSIAIENGYYLVGWYLSNGTTVNVFSNNDIIQNAEFMQLVSSSASGKKSGNVVISVSPLVEKRSVQLEYHAEGEGLSNTDEVAPVYYYKDAEVLLSTTKYQKIGYTFANWTTTNGTISNNKYSLTGNAWNLLWEGNNGTSAHSWSAFATEDEKQKTVVLNAVFTKVVYKVSIDGQGTLDLVIDQTITFTPSAGLDYATYQNKETSASLNGNSVAGYSVKSFMVQGNIQPEVTENGLTSFTLNLAEIQKLIAEENYYSASEDACLTITTERDANQYKIYIKQNENDYYQVSFTGSAEQGGTDENGVFVYVTFGQKPTNLSFIKVTRDGYKPTGYEGFDQEQNYTNVGNRTITPVFERDEKSNYIKDQISLTESETFKTQNNVTNKQYEFYIDWIGFENDTYESLITSNFVVKIFDNGDQAVSAEFKSGENTILNATNLTFKDVYQIFKQTKSYTFGFEYVVTMKDTLTSQTYQLTYDVQTFSFLKNEIMFKDTALKSYYTGTSDFVEAPNSDFGTILDLRYNAVGEEYQANSKDIFQNAVEQSTVSIVDENGKYVLGNYNATVLFGKASLGMTNEEYNLINDIYTNLSTSDLGASATVQNGVEVVLTPAVVKFDSSMGIYVEGMTQTIAQNVQNKAFNVAENPKYQFTYSFNSLTLVNNMPNTYTGQENHTEDAKIFNIDGFVVKNLASEDVSSNFEWVISKESSYQVVNDFEAVEYIYSSRYFTANNGTLGAMSDSWQENYKNTFSISKLMVDGKSVLPNDNGEFANQYNCLIGNQILFTIVGNKTNKLIISFNQELIGSHTVTFNITVSESLDESLVLYNWQEDTVVDSDLFGNITANRTISFASASTTQGEHYAIFTDVSKVEINYNNGFGETPADTETKYVSTSGGEITIDDKTDSQNEVVFAGFEVSGSGISATDNDGNYTIANVTSGSKATLKAKWNLDQAKVEAKVNQLITEYRNSPINGDKTIKINDIVSFNLSRATAKQPPVVMFGADKEMTVSLVDGSNYGIVLDLDDTFGYIKMENDGSYTITYTFMYSDTIQALQQVQVSKTFKLTMEKTGIEIIDSTALNNFTFANKDYASEVKINSQISYYQENQLKTENQTITIGGNGLKESNIFFDGDEVSAPALNSDTNPIYLQIDTPYDAKNFYYAGNYTINAGMFDAFDSYINFVNTASPISFEIAKDQIALADYNDQISVGKLFGTNDPDPIVDDITIVENNNDVVTLTFTRSGDNQVGNHPLTFKSISEEDQRNYEVDASGLTAQFVIAENTSGIVSVTISGGLHSTYNGKEITSFDVVYEGEKFLLKAYATSEEVVSKEISVKLLVEDNEYDLIEDVRATVANSINVNFVSGTLSAKDYKKEGYGLEITLVEGSGYDSIDASKGDNKLYIDKAPITITSVTKEFDRTNSFTKDNVEVTGNVESEVLTISGNFASEKAGEQSLENLQINGDSANNYYIANPEFKGNIAKKTVENATANATVNSFVYGQISNTTNLEQLKVLLGELKITIDGFNDVLEKGYAEISSFEIVDATYSSSDNLNVNSTAYTVRFVINSNDYTLTNNNAEIEISITAKELDLSSTTIAKQYDGTNSLPNGIDWIGFENVVLGDEVSVNLTASYYQETSKKNGISIHVELQGTDSANYIVKDNVVGNITALTINLNVDTTENQPVWVEDGKNIVIDNPVISISYPFDEGQDGESALASMPIPSRYGYEFKGYSIKTEDGTFEVLTGEKLEQYLESIATDAGNIAKTGKIYPTWKIKNYTVSISGNNLASISDVSVSLENVIGDITTGTVTYEIEYFQGFYFTVNANNGYKIKQFNISGDYNPNSEGEKGTSSCKLDVKQVLGNLTINVETESVSITFNIDKNIPVVSGANIVETSSAWSTKTVVYTDLTDEKLVDFLPEITLTSGTFVLSGFAGDKEVELTSEQTLKDFIDEIYSTLDGNKEINLTAQWVGEEYTISFDANGGEIIDNFTATAVFGGAITLPEGKLDFPVAEKEGQVYSYQDAYGKTYTKDSTFTTIDESKNVTFYATWSDGNFEITFEIDDNLDVKIEGAIVENGSTRNISYSEALTFDIVASEGYTFNVLADVDNGFFGQATTSNVSPFTISKITANSILKFVAVPNENALTISYNEEQVQSVMVDGEAYSEEMTKETGSTVTIVLTAKVGYQFTSSSAIITSGNGKVSSLLSEENTVITITWSGFTQDTTISVTSEAKSVVMTWGDMSSYVDDLTINGESKSIEGDYLDVVVGNDVSIEITLKYGYEKAKLTSENATITNENNAGLNENKVVIYTATINGFVQDFEIALTASERTWTVTANVESYSENRGNVTVTPDGENNLVYNSSVTLQATPSSSQFGFIGWYRNDELVSENSTYVIDANFANKDILESGNLNYVAKFEYNAIEMSFTAGLKGKIEVSINDTETFMVESGMTQNKTLFINDKIDVTIYPDTGYELEQFMADDQDKTSEVIESKFSFIVTADGYKKISATFKASEIHVDVTIAVQVGSNNYEGNSLGGKLYLANSLGEKLEEGYLPPSQGSLEEGVNYKVLTYSDQMFYLIAEANEGYKFSINVKEGNATIDEVALPEGKVLYRISNSKDLTVLQGIFKAEQQIVEIKFVTDFENGQGVDAGKLNVSNNITVPSEVSGTNSQKLTISTITGANIDVELGTSFNFQLAQDESGNVKVEVLNSKEGFTITNNAVIEQDSDTILRTGYTYKSSIKLQNVNSSVTILILVEPYEYNVEFYVDEADDSLGERVTIENVVYGENLDLSSLSDDERARLTKSKAGYTLHGYYTRQLGQLGQGSQYLDAQLNSVNPWGEKGYVYDGTVYKVADNYNPETRTFTLYAGWSYDKVVVNIDFIPQLLKGKTTATILDVVSNINAISHWVSASDVWYGEFGISDNLKLELQAINFEGYEFAYWNVSGNGTNVQYSSTTVTLTEFVVGQYLINAVYYPKYTMTIESNNTTDPLMCGSTYLMQDDVVITGTSFDSQKPLTLVAEEKLGYAFKYWTDQEGKIYSGIEQNDGKFTYDMGLRETPLYLTAIFEGDEVGMKFDTTSYNHGSINAVYVNGKQIEDFSNEFTIKIGDKVEIEVANENGYGIDFEGPVFNLEAATNRYVYIAKAEDLQEGSSSTDAVIIVKPISTQKEISFKFNLTIDGQSQLDEINLTGTRRFVYTINGTIIQNVLVGEGSVVEGLLFGGTVSLTIVPGTNFAIGSVVISNENGMIENIVSMANGGSINISLDILSKFFIENKPYTITIDFEKMVWSDARYRAESLDGNGTEDDPYIIREAKDMGFVSWAVNTNRYNENGIAYADCAYKVVNDISFYGKYWEPVGTRENPFNGILDLGSYNITDISFYGEYTNPDPSYFGLLWIYTEHALIIQTNNVLGIILGIVFSILFLILLIILIFIIVKKKKKKKYEEYLNG